MTFSMTSNSYLLGMSDVEMCKNETRLSVQVQLCDLREVP